MDSPAGSAALPAEEQGSSQADAHSNTTHQEKNKAGSSAAAQGGSRPHHAVRFSSVNQEIEPDENLRPMASLVSQNPRPSQDLDAQAQQAVQNLSSTLQSSSLHDPKASQFGFEPLSLPGSATTSHENSPHLAAVDATRAAARSPRPSPPSSSMHSPPLTPAATLSREAKAEAARASGLPQGALEAAAITPQGSPPRSVPPPTSLAQAYDSSASSTVNSRPSSLSERISTRPTSTSDGPPAGIEAHPKHTPRFTVGPSADSESSPGSRETSPPGTPGGSSGVSTPYMFPTGEVDDPYARSKRPPQSKKFDNIDARFVFGGKDAKPKRGQHLPRSSASASDLRVFEKPQQQSHHHHHHHPHLFSSKKDKDYLNDDASSLSGKQHGSMAELKRFFRIGHKSKHGPSPSSSSISIKSSVKGSPQRSNTTTIPFGEDHGLSSRYGKFGKVLGSGAGGSVRVMKRSRDGRTFAVKQFRARHSYETEREYSKKVTAEFCIGSTLHNGNVIETLDIIQERGAWYEVMEYAPYDLFAIVMTGKMSREEVACSFKQILNGVAYLHSMGLAHRDLKLDNVVVNEHGIMKLIDFGSATVFRYPFENDIVLASGVVGSDPYLAPEVYDNHKYDPQPTDIWSLAIIFCCMSLRRFPWKAPRLTDNSYKLFAAPPSPGQPGSTNSRPKPEGRTNSAPDLSGMSGKDNAKTPAPSSEPHHEESAPNGDHRKVMVGEDRRSSTDRRADNGGHGHKAIPIDTKPVQQTVIKGPWRLLRLLPRESRSIVGQMLEIDPKKRATLDDVNSDNWIVNIPACHQDVGGKVYNAPGHEHTLEPGTAITPVTSKK
ncbi:Pkinase-domain-containing protein [Xylona heveae TC161]|uniref:non-specific serine/threonine protein kinase n=1 Tax=Xylona heveae (strain CBS 132557 / TC161) TaxID=1328760 RepID=A0A164ZP25_XYLHT|nr:Pkinase-domain-containing protein [Xylona heveae TC161]KZF19331.1 Pkinase-domain-containing protein [Xylona heveae TC161]